MKKIVISAVNINEGGPLTVLKDCLREFQKIYKNLSLEIVVFVHKTSLVQEYSDDFTIIEYPQIKSSWLKRLKFEYWRSKQISLKMAPNLWISLHDITPNVTCKQVVYCHNPSPFYKLKPSNAFTDPTFFLFCLFYSFLYRVNIRKNEFVIVQQQWLREEFERTYKVKTVVSYPSSTLNIVSHKIERPKRGKFSFFFPAFPRVAKNFEILLEAAKILARDRDDFEVILTIDGTENKYARQLFSGYNNIEIIKFSGSKKRNEVFDMYQTADSLVFPSKLETWGLPISEFKNFQKPMLLADLKYAHETVGESRLVKFFNPDDANMLSKYMALLIDNKLIFDINQQTIPDAPFFKTWEELVNFLVKC